MADELTLPRPMVMLGEALRPIAETLRTRMNEPPPFTDTVPNIVDLVGEHLDRIADGVEQLSREINGGIGQVASVADTPDAKVYRMAGRMEVELERLIDSYDDVRRLETDSEDRLGWLLLGELYRETLAQVQDWFDELLTFLNDPVEELKRHGVERDDDGNYGEVTIALDLATPPVLHRLTDWVEDRTSGSAVDGWSDGGDMSSIAGGSEERSRIVVEIDANLEAEERAARELEERRERRWYLLAGALFGWWIGSG